MERGATGITVRGGWVPRKVLADLDVILSTDGSCLGWTLEPNVHDWDRMHDTMAADPKILGLVLDLAGMLPKWMGGERQRMIVAYEAVFGRRSESIVKTIAETAEAILNEQTRQRRLDRE